VINTRGSPRECPRAAGVMSGDPAGGVRPAATHRRGPAPGRPRW
jgi:hypothetical protein